jgi:hypothetical protein
MSIEKIDVAATPYSLAIGNAIGGNVSGGILFGNSSNNLAQNSTQLFWDETNTRLGVGIAASLLAKLHIKGSGATSATSSALFVNSSGNAALQIKDDLSTTFRTGVKINSNSQNGRLTIQNTYNNSQAGIYFADNSNDLDTGYKFADMNVSQFFSHYLSGAIDKFVTQAGTQIHTFDSNGNWAFNRASLLTSAVLSVDSTTKGFASPRMTTAQKNAIVTPTAGLEVFDTTLAKKCVYSGAAWETVTSI